MCQCPTDQQKHVLERNIIAGDYDGDGDHNAVVHRVCDYRDDFDYIYVQPDEPNLVPDIAVKFGQLSIQYDHDRNSDAVCNE
ncbi:hypothetical protein A0H81_14094 [Grifola frondosa]|uniref:Uncharacterized protein n=1 Tax=Grifola frondosa TaxID=5627 RepID=A0A1C7LNQ8_GRIFR|nr:hypothetical protein A0H81_14094 [Grifola frondosa]